MWPPSWTSGIAVRIRQTPRFPTIFFALLVLALIAGSVAAHFLLGGDTSVVVSDALAVGLGVGALGYARVQFRDARVTIGELSAVRTAFSEAMSQLESDINELEAEISTRRIGTSPDFLREVAELLDTAQEEIIILCDTPAYGAFSNPEAHAAYASAIKAKAATLHVRLVCANAEERSRLHEQQLSRDGWETLRESARMPAFLRRYGDRETVESISRSQFLALAASADERTLAEVFDEAEQVVTTGLIMPVYFWIVDRRKAIFALAPFSREALEVGFQTNSVGLVAALRGIFDRYVTASSAAQQG